MSRDALTRRVRYALASAVVVGVLPLVLPLWILRSEWLYAINRRVHDPLRSWAWRGWMRDSSGRWWNMKHWRYRGTRFERRERPLRGIWKTWVTRLPDPAYTLLLRFTIETVQYDDDGSFESRWSFANIALGGDSRRDAEHSLVAEILDTYDTLESERHLGFDAEQQLEALRKFVYKKVA